MKREKNSLDRTVEKVENDGNGKLLHTLCDGGRHPQHFNSNTDGMRINVAKQVSIANQCHCVRRGNVGALHARLGICRWPVVCASERARLPESANIYLANLAKKSHSRSWSFMCIVRSKITHSFDDLRNAEPGRARARAQTHKRARAKQQQQQKEWHNTFASQWAIREKFCILFRSLRPI